MMSIRRITAFKAQHCWLLSHLDQAIAQGFEQVPHRITLSRRYKALYPVLQAFIAFVGSWAEILHPELDSRILIEDASLFKAHGPVWHQSDRLAGQVPDKLRNLDQAASWRKSAYHGWVYGYSLHLTCNRSGFPKLAQVETACISESQVIEEKKQALFALDPFAITGDNAYFKAIRVRNWAAAGVILLTPAVKWQKGRYAAAYHRFILCRLPRGLLRGFCVLAKSVSEGAKFRNTPSACGGDRNFEDFACLLPKHPSIPG